VRHHDARSRRAGSRGFTGEPATIVADGCHDIVEEATDAVGDVKSDLEPREIESAGGFAFANGDSSAGASRVGGAAPPSISTRRV
jgi:hypothetical protein